MRSHVPPKLLQLFTKCIRGFNLRGMKYMYHAKEGLRKIYHHHQIYHVRHFLFAQQDITRVS